MSLDDTLDAAGNATEHALGRGVRAALHGIGSGLGAAGWDSAVSKLSQRVAGDKES